MLDFLKARNPVVAGWRVIVTAIVCYILQLVFNFGVPQFTFNTAKGKLEIAYALSTFLVIGCGVWSIYTGMKEQPKQKL